MKVNIKKLSVEMEVKNSGVEFEIRNTRDEFLGDMILNRSGLKWCKGKKTRQNGILIDWDKLIEIIENQNK